MLNISLKGTYQDPTGYDWDYYGDDTNASVFYIVPRPQFVTNDNGDPSFQITRYKTDDASNGSGYCRFDIELSVPAEVEKAITAEIPQKFPSSKAPYSFNSLNYNPGGKAYFDFASGSDQITYSAPVSNYGSNVASFLMSMTQKQLDTIVSGFSTKGSPFEVGYHLSVPARLPAVNATLSFDSAIAFQYQVTQPSYNSWGEETSPGNVQTMLKESASSNVKIDWGTSKPSSDLRQAVADWANQTLADLVTAEVQKAIQLQGIKSGSSFNINEVSSFTNNYSENMVVDWIISPRAALPSFPTLGLDIKNFTSEVEERQQTMTVSTYLPFQADGIKRLPDGGDQALVDHVEVTVTYPGLDEANATYKFTENGSHTFTAPYDENAGPNWSLEYTVTYWNTSAPPVKSPGPIKISSGTYTLEVAEAGILTVKFDAQQAFATEGTKPIEVDIAFSYINSDGSSDLIQQVLKIKASDNPQVGSINSMYPLPITSKYNYQVTYIYDGGVQYVAKLVQGQTGFMQIIPAANAVHSCNLIVFVPGSQGATDPILDGPTVQMYYAKEPSSLPPGVSSQPTKESPAVFNIQLSSDPKQNTIGRATFVGLLSGDQPLIYSTSLDMASGQIDIDDALVENDQPSVMITPTQRYFTLEITPIAVDWSKATYKSIEVFINAKVAKGTSSNSQTNQPTQRAYTWNKGESGSKYVTYSIQAGNTVTYDWKVNYIMSDGTVKTASGSNATDVILNIPATPTAS